MTVRPGYSEKIVHSELITAYIGLGSNLGFRAGNLLLGVRGLLEASFHVTRLSAIYETEPVDLVDSEPFLNMAAEIKLGGGFVRRSNACLHWYNPAVLAP